jgi:hypothetical protein
LVEEREKSVAGLEAAGVGVRRCGPGDGLFLERHVRVQVDASRGRAFVDRVGCAARSGFTWCEFRPFPRSLPPNPAGAFQRTGLSSDYAACVTGVAWMTSWQGWQTTSVLRRFLAMRAAHAGWLGSGVPSRASLAIWWTATVAPCSHSSHLRVRSRWISSLRGVGARTGTGSMMNPFSFRRSGIPPNRATRSFLPLRGSGLQSTCAVRVVSRWWPCNGPPSWSPWTCAWPPGS